MPDSALQELRVMLNCYDFHFSSWEDRLATRVCILCFVLELGPGVWDLGLFCFGVSILICITKYMGASERGIGELATLIFIFMRISWEIFGIRQGVTGIVSTGFCRN